MLSTMMKNWKTSLAGAVLLGCLGLESIGVHVPGFTVTSGMFVLGLGMLLGKDGDQTGV